MLVKVLIFLCFQLKVIKSTNFALRDAIFVLAMTYGILMAALLGKIDHFDAEVEEWPQYMEEL